MSGLREAVECLAQQRREQAKSMAPGAARAEVEQIARDLDHALAQHPREVEETDPLVEDPLFIAALRKGDPMAAHLISTHPSGGSLSCTARTIVAEYDRAIAAAQRAAPSEPEALRSGVEFWLESIASQPDDELVRAGDVRAELIRLLERHGATQPGLRTVAEGMGHGGSLNKMDRDVHSLAVELDRERSAAAQPEAPDESKAWRAVLADRERKNAPKTHISDPIQDDSSLCHLAGWSGTFVAPEDATCAHCQRLWRELKYQQRAVDAAPAPWRPIVEFDGRPGTYFVICDGSPFMGYFDRGVWRCDASDEPVHPSEFMAIPDYPALLARRAALPAPPEVS